jgi:drug/metabolite transporter (DMT)-like permease
MVGFAANSLLCRAALRGGAIDAASFTAIRLATGAIVLLAIVMVRGTSSAAAKKPGVRSESTWASMLALAAYAVGFSFAYLEIGAGAGALILFGSVQLTMIVGGLRRGERPVVRQWLGWLVAITGLIAINAPGLDPPPPRGAALMAAAGIAWGIYSLRGRGITRPLVATAGNFARSVPIAGMLIAIALATGGAHAAPHGIALAAASGGIASGLGYSLWYAVVPALGTTRAALVQLSVPVITAAAAVGVLAEPLRMNIVLGGTAIVGGLALALSARARP